MCINIEYYSLLRHLVRELLAELYFCVIFCEHISVNSISELRLLFTDIVQS